MPSMKNDKETGLTYWRSLDELAHTPEFQEAVQREFPGDHWDRLPPATRRRFLKVMGASLAMAGLTACRWPKEEIVPFAHRPEGRTPGVPERFATSMELGGAALGMVVTSFDGRPIKAEGNSLHPDSLGALTAIAQADILQLYDPDRSRRLLLREGGQQYVKTWSDFEAAAAEYFAGDGTGVAVLAGASSSPARAMVRNPSSRPTRRPVGTSTNRSRRDNEREGTRLVFGRALRVHPKLDAAGVVACFDADPLFDHPSSLRLAREFAAARHPESGTGARLYAAESSYSLTGVRADHRVAVPSRRVPVVLARVAHVLVAEHGLELPAAAAGYAGAAGQEISEQEIQLRRAPGGRSGESPRCQRHFRRSTAGARGARHWRRCSIRFSDRLSATPPIRIPTGRRTSMRSATLAAAMASGSVETLLILGGNPVVRRTRRSPASASCWRGFPVRCT